MKTFLTTIFILLSFQTLATVKDVSSKQETLVNMAKLMQRFDIAQGIFKNKIKIKEYILVSELIMERWNLSLSTFISTNVRAMKTLKVYNIKMTFVELLTHQFAIGNKIKIKKGSNLNEQYEKVMEAILIMIDKRNNKIKQKLKYDTTI
jgi:hypothetical protein